MKRSIDQLAMSGCLDWKWI